MKSQAITFFALIIMATAMISPVSFAGDVEILDVKASSSGSTWSFSVTLKHADEGWDHYADHWAVYSPDGSLLGERVLAHPHVDEQPFTRSLSGVVIPDGVKEVVIKARDSVHGVSPKTYLVRIAE
ncbi:MAG: hypothetical protein ABJY83_08630 [Roseibium sp.]